MTKEIKFHKTDILFWANINPDKRGAFEDYICKLSHACIKSGLNITFVLGNKTTQSVLSLFQEFKVDYYLLTESEITSKFFMIKIARKIKPKILHLTFMNYNFLVNTVYHMIGCRIIVTDQLSGVHIKNIGFFLKPLKYLKKKLDLISVGHFIAVSNSIAKRLSGNVGISN